MRRILFSAITFLAVVSTAACGDPGETGTTGSTGGGTTGGTGGATGGTSTATGGGGTDTGGTGSGGSMTGPVVTAVATGDHVCAATSADKVFCWGNYYYGDLGQPFSDVQPNAKLVPGLSGVEKIAVGGNVTCVIDGAGSLKCFGHNDFGQLGNGSADGDDHPTPAEVMTDVADVAIEKQEGGAVFAIKNDGTLWGWGYNGGGQLATGSNDYDPHATPAQINGISDVKQVSIDVNTVCAVTGDGSLHCWGSGINGKLGVDEGALPQCTDFNGASFGCLTAPTKVAGISGIAKVEVAQRATHALGTDGSVWGFGINGYGDIGIGTNDEGPLPPTKIMGFTATDISAYGTLSGDTTCALKQDGSVWCWGSNYLQALGQDFGFVGEADSPEKVDGLPGPASRIEVNGTVCVVIEADGSLWCWGDNNTANLGNGDAGGGSEYVPAKVEGLD